jgi:hypothetical protein
MADLKPHEMLRIDLSPKTQDWMDIPVNIKPGVYCYPAKPEKLEIVGMPTPNKPDWKPQEEDWGLPEGWEETFFDGMKERLEKHRSFKVFMDICVRCGACAD